MNTLTLWFLAALLAPTFWALTNVLDSALRKEIIKDDLTLTWLGGVMKLPLVILFFWLGGFEFPDSLSFLMILLSGALLTLPILLYYRAMEHEEASRVALIMQFVPLFTIFIAYFLLGEKLSPLQFVAFFLLLLGGALAVLKRKKEKWHVSKYLLLVLFAAFIWAISDVVFKKYEVAFSNFNSAFAIYSLGSFLVSITLFFIARKKEKMGDVLKKLTTRAWSLVIISVISGNIGTLFFNYALTLKEASLTAALMALQPLMAFILGLLLFYWIKEVKKDELNKEALFLKGGAFILIMSGIILLQV